jgi:hypothetical protein
MSTELSTEPATAEPKPIPPKMPTPTFKNPAMDRIFKRAKRRVKTVPVTIRFTDEETGAEGEEVVEFLAHEMSAGMKGRFEAIMQENARKIISEDEIDGETDQEELAERLTGSMDMGNFKISVVAASVTDLDGNPIIDMNEVEAAQDLPAYFIDTLFEASFVLSGLGKPKQTEKAAENE